MAINALILYVLVDLGGLNVPSATLVSAEACTLLRFFVNHYWVFNLTNPTLRKCLNYHLVNLFAFVVWWAITNVLAIAGVHYQIASILALGASTIVSLVTNFLWVWRRRATDPGLPAESHPG